MASKPILQPSTNDPVPIKSPYQAPFDDMMEFLLEKDPELHQAIKDAAETGSKMIFKPDQPNAFHSFQKDMCNCIIQLECDKLIDPVGADTRRNEMKIWAQCKGNMFNYLRESDDAFDLFEEHKQQIKAMSGFDKLEKFFKTLRRFGRS